MLDISNATTPPTSGVISDTVTLPGKAQVNALLLQEYWRLKMNWIDHWHCHWRRQHYRHYNGGRAQTWILVFVGHPMAHLQKSTTLLIIRLI